MSNKNLKYPIYHHHTTRFVRHFWHKIVSHICHLHHSNEIANIFSSKRIIHLGIVETRVYIHISCPTKYSRCIPCGTTSMKNRGNEVQALYPFAKLGAPKSELLCPLPVASGYPPRGLYDEFASSTGVIVKKNLLEILKDFQPTSFERTCARTRTLFP